MRKLYVILFVLICCEIASIAQDYRLKDLGYLSGEDESEMAIVPFDSGFVFMSNRKIPSTSGKTGPGGEPMYNLYYAEANDGEIKGEGKLFLKMLDFIPRQLVLNDVNYGPVSFARNNSMLCMVIENESDLFRFKEQCFENTDNLTEYPIIGEGLGGLYFSYRTDGSWSKFIPFTHNSTEKYFSFPSLTEDGKTLYFAADTMPDSQGGWDIYVSRFEKNEWTTPENLGNMINTPGTEIFPFFHEESNRLYYSSNGPASLNGTYDLYYSFSYKNAWMQPMKLLTRSYSTEHELSIYVDSTLSQGFVSSRPARGRSSSSRFREMTLTEYVPLPTANAMLPDKFCFRLRETTLDTIDYEMFAYEWTIEWANRDTVVPGHDIRFCFPGPGDYHIQFNVTNKVTDTTMLGVATLDASLNFTPQPKISAPDTVVQGDQFILNAENTYWPKWKEGIEEYRWEPEKGRPQKVGVKVPYVFENFGEYNVILCISGYPDEELEKRKSKRQLEQVASFKTIFVKPRPDAE